MLHWVSQLSAAVVARIAAGDAVLLQHSALWALRKGHVDNGCVLQLLALPCDVMVLEAHLLVSGLDRDTLLAGVKVIDYADLVALTVENAVMHTWS
jgi:tRNA 2-thiouridine synthesizing protein B